MNPLKINQKIAALKGLKFELPGRSNAVLIKREPNDAGYWANWAENLSDAWELMEEMPEGTTFQKWPFKIQPWYACRSPEDLGEEIFEGYGVLSTIAISKAWIEWKGRRNEK